MGCYGCGSNEGSEVRLCPRCVRDRKSHRDGYVEQQRKTIGVGEYGRPYCPRALIILLGIRLVIVAFAVLGLVIIALVVAYGAPEVQRRLSTSDFPIGGVLLAGFPLATQIVIVCGLYLFQMAIDLVGLVLLFKMRRLGIYVTLLSLLLGDLISLSLGGSLGGLGNLLMSAFWLAPVLWWSQMVSSSPVPEEYVAPRNSQGRAVRDGRA